MSEIILYIKCCYHLILDIENSTINSREIEYLFQVETSKLFERE